MLPRRNLGSVQRSGSTRRARSREHFARSREPRSLVFPQRISGVRESVVTPLILNAGGPGNRPSQVAIPTLKGSCPVCLNVNPGDLESHLRQYHVIEDMRRVFHTLLDRRELPGPLRYMCSQGLKDGVSRVLANYCLTGFLQLPSLPGPRAVTRVLWRNPAYS